MTQNREHLQKTNMAAAQQELNVATGVFNRALEDYKTYCAALLKDMDSLAKQAASYKKLKSMISKKK